MKTKLAAAVMMMMVAAATPARVIEDARPSPIGPGATTRLSPRTGSLVTVKIDHLGVTWISPVESRIGAVISVPAFANDPHFAQVLLDGELVAQGSVRAGASMVLTDDVKSDGKSHELRVRVYRDLLDGPRIFVKEQAFPIWLPAQ